MLRIGSKVKVVNPDHPNYERTGMVNDYCSFSSFPFGVTYDDGFYGVLAAWELMEVTE